VLTGRKILLADDSLTIQKVVSLTFGDEGCIVICVSDGAAALEKMAEIEPDIVLADIYMPGLNGYELCRRIRESESFKHVPVLLLVGTFEPYDEEEARRVGANDVLTKPFQSIRELVGKVGNLLGGKSEEEPPREETVRHEATQYYADSSMDDEMIEATPVREPSHAAQSFAPTAAPEAASETSSERAAEASTRGGAAEEAHEPSAHEALATMSDAAPPEAERAPDELRSVAISSMDARQVQPDTETSETADEARHGETPQAVDLSAVFEPEFAASAAGETAMSAAQSGGAPLLHTKAWDEEVLELDEETFAREVNEDFILELEDAAPAENFEPEPLPVFEAAGFEPSPSGVGMNMAPPPVSAPAISHEIFAEPSTIENVAAREAASAPVMQEAPAMETQGEQAAAVNVSPELVEAVARRVVELMSSKIVEEIAWEVVPQLSELMIKRKLEGGKI
jgi:CheY-like chemotaxis protein